MSKHKILIIDDEAPIRNFLRVSLQASQFEVLEAASGKEGLELASKEHPGLIVLDLGLPDMEGDEVLSQLRKWTQIPIIVLTVRGADSDKVTLLDAGANDYLTKPFSVVELMARIRAALRVAAPKDDVPVIRIKSLELDVPKHEVRINGKPLKLTVTEFTLLILLAKDAGKLVTQKQILGEIWGPNALDNTHYLRIYIGQIRKKLSKEDSALSQLIVTEPGVGYRLDIS